MKRFLSLFSAKEEKNRKILDYKERAIVKAGREQFKTLMKKGLTVPIVLL